MITIGSDNSLTVAESGSGTQKPDTGGNTPSQQGDKPDKPSQQGGNTTPTIDPTATYTVKMMMNGKVVSSTAVPGTAMDGFFDGMPATYTYTIDGTTITVDMGGTGGSTIDPNETYTVKSPGTNQTESMPGSIFMMTGLVEGSDYTVEGTVITLTAEGAAKVNSMS